MKDFAATVIALVLFTLLVMTVFALVMACWGLMFMAFDWLFPFFFADVLPGSIAHYTPFTLGAIVGFFMMLLRGFKVSPK